MKYLFYSLSVFLIYSCFGRPEADLLVKNAVVYTVNKDFETTDGFVVRNGKILEIGNAEKLEVKYNVKEIYDAGGKTIVPGLIDAHAHLYGLGLNIQQLDLTGTQSFEEVIERLVEYQKNHLLNFIQGRGWDQNDWAVKDFPTNEKLNELFPDTPVALRRIDGHALLVNDKALELAGITAETKIAGGEIVLKNGKPSGVLIDNAMEPVNEIIPSPSKEISERALTDAQNYALSFGLTTIDDAGLDPDIIDLIDNLQRDGKMKLRIYAMVSYSPENLDYYLKKGIYKTDRLTVRSFKVYSDGALGSRGAALRQEYSDRPKHFGIMITPAAELDELAEKLARSGFQMNTHAIGDSATIAVLRAYKNALKNENDRRWRLEHAQILSPEAFAYFSNNILPSVQPTHATSDMYWAEDRVGAGRMKGAYAYKTLLDKTGIIALGTDFPVEQVNPFYTFYAAVVRKDLKGWPDNGFQTKDALSREEALRGMTIWAAYSNFEEREKGSIEVGKFADFTVLDRDIMKIEESQLPGTKAVATFINGEKVFELK